MDYTPKISHYLIPAFLFVAGTAAGMYWYIPLGVVLYLVGFAAIGFITVTGAWNARTSHWYSVAEMAKQMPSLSHEQQERLIGRIPELRMMFGGSSSEAVMMVEDSEVDYSFFVEFMEQSNAMYTWPKRDIDGNGKESREVRRGKWDKFTSWLMSRRYLIAAPTARETYQWRSGAYLQLWNSYVLPYADLVGRRVMPIAQERTELYQAEA